MSLKGKVVLITGASSGIGEGTAVNFASLGAKLSLHGRNEENLQKVVTKCQAAGAEKDQIFTVLGDLSDEKVIEKVIQETVHYFGQLDVLVNNAGMLSHGSLETQTLADYDLVMSVNTRAVFYMSQLAVPHLKKTKGSIVNVSSIAGSRSFQDVVGYAMSKAAVDQLTRCSALDLASLNIRVNCVSPSIIKTDIFKRSGLDGDALNKFEERRKGIIPLGRDGTTDEVAKTIAFLASDEASYITGATLPVCGGYAILCPR